MAKSYFKPVYERSLAEQAEMLKPRLLAVQQENLALGLYNSYRDPAYPEKNIVVRAYADHKEVVRINGDTGDIEIIKVIR